MPALRVLRLALAATAAAAMVAAAVSNLRLEQPRWDPGALASDLAGAQQDLEDTAWALRAIFYRVDLGDEWVEHRGPVDEAAAAARDAGATTSLPDGPIAAEPPYALPLRACFEEVGGPMPQEVVSTEAVSPRFVRFDGAFALSATLVTTSPAAADGLVQRALDPRFADCIGRRTADSDEGTPVRVLGTEPLDQPPLGDALHAFRVRAIHDEGEGEREIVMDAAVVRLDRAVLAFVFASPVVPVVAADRDAVTRALVGRLAVLPNVGAASPG